MRRTVLGIFGAALVVAGAASAQTVKIGVVTSYSGFLAQAGDSMDKGLGLYLKTHETALPPGVRIELIKRDDGSSGADLGKSHAQQLVTRDRVQFLAGLVSSPVAAAIAPVATEARVPLVLMNAAGSALTRLSPYIVRVSFTLWQQAYPMGKWAAALGARRAYIAVSDYIPGHDAEAAFARGFADRGGEIVGSVRFAPSTLDFAPFLERIKEARPETLFVFVPGGKQATSFVKAYVDLGLKAAGIAIVSTQDLVTDDELPNMGDAPLGIVSSGTYSIAGRRPANEAFLAAWRREYGDKIVPNYVAVGGWDGMAAILDVVTALKGRIEPEPAMALLRDWKSADSPRGPIEIDTLTRDVVQNVYIRRVERQGDALANVEFDTIARVKDPWKELNPPK